MLTLSRSRCSILFCSFPLLYTLLLLPLHRIGLMTCLQRRGVSVAVVVSAA